MDTLSIAAYIEDFVGILKSAQESRGPYVLLIDGVKTIVSREQFLDFYIDCAIEDLWNLKESIEEGRSTCKSL